MIDANDKWKSSYTITNQNSASVVIRDYDANPLLSKTVSRGTSLVTSVAPTFTITKIVLTKWYAGNLFDRPDPWFEVISGSETVGETQYYSDCTDGERLTWSNLNITIKNISKNLTFKLQDYNLGYSTNIAKYTEYLLSQRKGNSSFECTNAELSFTVYGTWNY